MGRRCGGRGVAGWSFARARKGATARRAIRCGAPSALRHRIAVRPLTVGSRCGAQRGVLRRTVVQRGSLLHISQPSNKGEYYGLQTAGVNSWTRRLIVKRDFFLFFASTGRIGRNAVAEMWKMSIGFKLPEKRGDKEIKCRVAGL